jgi:hypothetical protein
MLLNILFKHDINKQTMKVNLKTVLLINVVHCLIKKLGKIITFLRHCRNKRCNRCLIRIQCRPTWCWRLDWQILFLILWIRCIENFLHKVRLLIFFYITLLQIHIFKISIKYNGSIIKLECFWERENNLKISKFVCLVWPLTHLDQWFSPFSVSVWPVLQLQVWIHTRLHV